MGFESIDQPSRSSEVEHNPKMSISVFLEMGGRQGVHGSSEVEHSKNKHFIFLVGRWGSPSNTAS